jgi:hypothetical protein
MPISLPDDVPLRWPSCDVVYEGKDLESLVARLAAAPHRIVDNPSVDREEH